MWAMFGLPVCNNTLQFQQKSNVHDRLLLGDCLGHCNAPSNGESMTLFLGSNLDAVSRSVLDYAPLPTTHNFGPHEENRQDS